MKRREEESPVPLARCWAREVLARLPLPLVRRVLQRLRNLTSDYDNE